MILISHRGNLHGPQPKLENKKEYIEEAILKGYDVEVDVWLHNGKLFLGHDQPEHLIDVSFLKNPSMWVHAKSIPTLKVLLDAGVHCFFHENDDATLTSQGYIWTHPNQILVPGAVAVMPENGLIGDIGVCYAVCSDFVGVEGRFE